MADSGEIRAATICYDALTVPPGKTVNVDVISFALEHRSGDSMTAVLPYVRRRSDDVDYGELSIIGRSQQFFFDSSIADG